MADTEKNQFALNINFDEHDTANFDKGEHIKCNEEDEISASKTAVLKVVKLDNSNFISYDGLLYVVFQ